MSPGPVPCSVIIAGGEPGRHRPARLAACLAAVGDQIGPDDDVLVVDHGDADRLPSWARRVRAEGRSLVPEQWAVGLAEATRPVVALTSASMVPDPGWLDRARAVAAGEKAGTGGAIEPGPALGFWDWAVYFCRYAPYLLPLEPTEALEVAADNAAYRTEVLARYRDHWCDGFWEPFVHRVMRADGHGLAIDPEMVVRLSAGVDPSAFARQRFLHARSHGHHRSLGQPRLAVAAACLTAPAVPPLLTARIVRRVWAKRRYRGRLAVSLAAVVWFSAWWAAGELAGRLDVVRRCDRR